MFKPALSNEARIGVSRSPSTVRGIHQGQDFAAQFGLPSPADPRFATFPIFAISGWNTLGDAQNVPRILNDTSYNGADTLTWVKASHLLKFGAEYVHTMFNQPTSGPRRQRNCRRSGCRQMVRHHGISSQPRGPLWRRRAQYRGRSRKA